MIRDGRDIGLGSAPQRRLVGLLCSRANSVVASDRLTEQLGLSPGALRTSVSRLRAVVGADSLHSATELLAVSLAGAGNERRAVRII